MGTVPLKSEAASRNIGMLRTALGPAITGWLDDPAIVEIMLNPDGRLWIDRLVGGFLIGNFNGLAKIVFNSFSGLGPPQLVRGLDAIAPAQRLAQESEAELLNRLFATTGTREREATPALLLRTHAFKRINRSQSKRHIHD